MSKSKSPWGPIVTTNDIDEEDPIRKLLAKIEAIKKENVSKDVRTINAIKQDKSDRINKIEKQISDLIYKKKTRKLFA